MATSEPHDTSANGRVVVRLSVLVLVVVWKRGRKP